MSSTPPATSLPVAEAPRNVPDPIVLYESRGRGGGRVPSSPPQVTVCVSLFDYAHYVVDCLESLRTQTLNPISIVVVDDASRDAGPECVRDWMEAHAARFGDLLLLRQPVNSGLAMARNTAIRHAQTEFVFVLDADNEIYPRCLETLLGALRSGRADFAYSIIEQFGEYRGLMGCDGWSRERLAQGPYIDAMAMLRHETWQGVGGYRRMQIGGWEDYDFWCTCAEAGFEGVLVPEILCRYRVHHRSMLRRSTDRLRNYFRICDDMRRTHPWIGI